MDMPFTFRDVRVPETEIRQLFSLDLADKTC